MAHLEKWFQISQIALKVNSGPRVVANRNPVRGR
jgi:hypothetical protein